MRLRIINPDYGLTEEQLQERVNRLSEKARPDTAISMECPVNNNIYIDSALDAALDSAEIIRMAMKAESDGCDAVGLYCFSDPALEACRETLTIPVIGGGQAAVLVAAMLGHTFSVLTTSGQRIAQKKEFIRSTGVDPTRLASVRSIDFTMEDQQMDRGQLTELLSGEALKCVADGADVVVLGCLSYVGLSEAISERAGVPVVDPAFALIHMAELVVAQGLSHSKRSFPYPPRRERSWAGGTIII